MSEGGHACDPLSPGDVILALRRDDPIGGELLGYGRERSLPGLEEISEESDLDAVLDEFASIGSGDERDERVQTEPPAGDRLRFWLLKVPEGQEQLAAGSLMKLRVELAGKQSNEAVPPVVLAQPNHFLDYSGGSPVELGPDHAGYLRQMGLPAEPQDMASPARVRVVDSGYSGHRASVVRAVDILDQQYSIADTDGHGTCVADIITTAAGRVDLEIFRVSDDRRRPTEWEVLQALSLAPFPHLINLSLSVGFRGVECSRCGRQPQSARTSVFEERLRELAEDGVIVVAAAGNSGKPDLAYPAKFGSCVAVQACSGNPPSVTSYSNQGALDQGGSAHPLVFICPGGDHGAGEGPVLDTANQPLDGTSYSAAYMTGLLASLWGELGVAHGPCDMCRSTVLSLAMHAASQSFPGFDASRHGHGLARRR